MSEDFSAEHDAYDEGPEFESHLNESGVEYEEDEEISTDEVDRVLESLTNLLESVESTTVHEHLEEAYNQIFSLVYEEEGVEEGLEEGESDSQESFSGDYEEAEFEEEDLDEEYDDDLGDDELLGEEAA